MTINDRIVLISNIVDSIRIKYKVLSNINCRKVKSISIKYAIIYVLRKYCKFGTVEIGCVLGRGDHSVISYATSQMQNWIIDSDYKILVYEFYYHIIGYLKKTNNYQFIK
jgi:hypothetical protein